MVVFFVCLLLCSPPPPLNSASNLVLQQHLTRLSLSIDNVAFDKVHVALLLKKAAALLQYSAAAITFLLSFRGCTT